MSHISNRAYCGAMCVPRGVVHIVIENAPPVVGGAYNV